MSIETAARASIFSISDPPSWPPHLDLSRKDIIWPYARGRAVLSTLLPAAVGGTLLRVRPGDRTTNTLGLAVGGVGLLIGPSMGQWCLGGRYAREGVLHSTARLVGAGGAALILDWGERKLEDANFFVLPVLPFVAVAVGAVVGLAGVLLLKPVAWSIREPPAGPVMTTGDNEFLPLRPRALHPTSPAWGFPSDSRSLGPFDCVTLPYLIQATHTKLLAG